ncbi:uncharacterized protein PV09_00325 [Verruconis gallopava]|uniref:Uncharacterized protein n=1 Tax=Verruconis gallopava TaxID=253628 RepID=A0A0D2ASF1_9PEZI|nr:uncharacterized protein PV09_00325 [Verruconis gallopava]KIW09440.1 hypothetical protein PV09_00325 [Verruconis gallopava]
MKGKDIQDANANIGMKSTTTPGYSTTTSERAPPKPFSNVPFRKDEDFVERSSKDGRILDKVDTICMRPAGRAALVGLGGVGKSQLAIEYAHRVRRRASKAWIFWVHASHSARFEEDVYKMAERIGLSQSGTSSEFFSRVRNWFSNEDVGDWLLILDNVDDEMKVPSHTGGQDISLASWLPQSDNGAILVTSRNMDIARDIVGRPQDIILVDIMSKQEAMQLLGAKLADVTVDHAEELIDALESIPLALVHAAAYINESRPRISTQAYMAHLKETKKRVQLLHKSTLDIRRDHHAPDSVLASWQVSFEHIQRKWPSAATLLSFMSFFNRQGIPEFMARRYGDVGYIMDHDAPKDDLHKAQFDYSRDVEVLRAFSLAKVTESMDALNMHGIVQLATREWLRSIDAEKRVYEAFVHIMASEFPNGEYINWDRCRTLYPHVSVILDTQPPNDEANVNSAMVLHNAGWFAWRQGLFEQAEDMLTKALDIRIKISSGGDIPSMVITGILGLVLENRGKYEAAENMHRRALELSKQLLGEQHRSTLTNMHNLALVLRFRGNIDEAEKIHTQVLAGRIETLGEDHIETLMSRENLADILSQKGKHDEAKEILQQVVEKATTVVDQKDPNTLTSRNNLANVLNSQKDYDAAANLYQEVLDLRIKMLGEEHRETLITMSNLANTLNSQGKHDEAVKVGRKVLATRRRVLGDDHPDTLVSFDILVHALECNGQKFEADQVQRQVESIRIKMIRKLQQAKDLSAQDLSSAASGSLVKTSRRRSSSGSRPAGRFVELII